ncbi:MAG: hypothetical protein ACREQD_12590, partial [Candidatus Binataceae bacterium]
LTIAILYARVRATDQAFKGHPDDRDLWTLAFPFLVSYFLVCQRSIVLTTFMHTASKSPD